jgi:hypothetical protein
MSETDINTAILDRARGGAELTEAELLELDAADVLSLGMLADEVRRSRVGDRVGFVRVLEIGADGSIEAQAGDVQLGAAEEVRLTTPGATLEASLDRIAQVRTRVGAGRRLTGCSLADLMAAGWGPLADVLAACRAAGLDALAEAPVDVVSPDDVATAVRSGLAPQTLSVKRWPGEGRIAVLVKARQILSANRALRRFAPLSREQSITAPTTGYHDVRMVALARLALPGVPIIEVDWHQYGPKLAQVALMFGANHFDRVSPVDDPALGPRRAAAEEVRRNIIAAGFTPAEPGEAA